MRLIKALKTVNYRLWFAILITFLLPTIYQTVRIYFLGNMPSDNGINIASQLQWVNLLLILAGDIYQIEAIDFGNWFFYAKEIMPKKSIIELNDTWRTEDENLKHLWNEVRYKKDLITEVLAMDGPYSKEISNDLFVKKDGDEVVVCLNYDGKFGLNSINNYFQESNEQNVFEWKEWTYKIGDPILFNENKRFPMLYNNLKGRIVDIKKGNDYLQFFIKVPLNITSIDSKKNDFQIVD